MRERYSIAKRFGLSFARMPGFRRQALGKAALGQKGPPPCPFQPGTARCRKPGGVCSIGSGDESLVIACPCRFDHGDLLPRWLAKIVGFAEVHLASEVPFMRSASTGRWREALTWRHPRMARRVRGSARKFMPSTSPEAECRPISSSCCKAKMLFRRSLRPFVARIGDRQARSALCRSFRSRRRRYLNSITLLRRSLVYCNLPRSF